MYLVIVDLLTVCKEMNSANLLIVNKIILSKLKLEGGSIKYVCCFFKDLSSDASTHIGQLPGNCQQLKIQGSHTISGV